MKKDALLLTAYDPANGEEIAVSAVIRFDRETGIFTVISINRNPEGLGEEAFISVEIDE